MFTWRALKSVSPRLSGTPGRLLWATEAKSQDRATLVPHTWYKYHKVHRFHQVDYCLHCLSVSDNPSTNVLVVLA